VCDCQGFKPTRPSGVDLPFEPDLDFLHRMPLNKIGQDATRIGGGWYECEYIERLS
jgi:hypothetical protein